MSHPLHDGRNRRLIQGQTFVLIIFSKWFSRKVTVHLWYEAPSKQAASAYGGHSFCISPLPLTYFEKIWEQFYIQFFIDSFLLYSHTLGSPLQNHLVSADRSRHYSGRLFCQLLFSWIFLYCHCYSYLPHIEPHSLGSSDERVMVTVQQHKLLWIHFSHKIALLCNFGSMTCSRRPWTDKI